jgi:fucose permease
MLDSVWFWIWAIPAVILFFAFGMMVLWAAMVNAQTGEPDGMFYGLLALVCGIPVAAIAAGTWPAWFPITFAIDVMKDRKKI